MSILAFDTHDFVRRLHNAKMATKQDLRETELKLELRIAETKSELIRWIVGSGFLQTALIAALLLKMSSGL